MKTRQQYLNNEISHHNYYMQFATEAMKQQVVDKIGIERIKKAIVTDEHLNNIPLEEWDMLSWNYWRNNQLMGEAQESASSATMTCIYKAIAKSLI